MTFLMKLKCAVILQQRKVNQHQLYQETTSQCCPVTSSRMYQCQDTLSKTSPLCVLNECQSVCVLVCVRVFAFAIISIVFLGQ